jgi:hypothetical protein
MECLVPETDFSSGRAASLFLAFLFIKSIVADSFFLILHYERQEVGTGTGWFSLPVFRNTANIALLINILHFLGYNIISCFLLLFTTFFQPIVIIF